MALVRESWIVCLAAALSRCVLAAPETDTAMREHFTRARAAQDSGDLATAAREYEAVTRLKPDFAEAYMNLGLVLHAAANFDASAAALATSLRLQPALFAAALFQGINYCKLGRPKDAAPLLAEVAAKQPANKHALFWYATALLGSGKSLQAVETLEHRRAALREDIDMLQLLGEAYQGAAADISEEVRAAGSDSPERRLMLAESFLAQGEWMAAEVYFGKLMNEKTPPARTYSGLATALLRQGRLEKAQAYYEQQLATDPWSVEAYCGIAETRILQGKLPEALVNLAVALRIRPEHTRVAIEPLGPAEFDGAEDL